MEWVWVLMNERETYRLRTMAMVTKWAGTPAGTRLSLHKPYKPFSDKYNILNLDPKLPN